jgi:hypothetical protein
MTNLRVCGSDFRNLFLWCVEPIYVRLLLSAC